VHFQHVMIQKFHAVDERKVCDMSQVNVSPSSSPGRLRCSMYHGHPSLGDADARCILVVHPRETQMLNVSLSSIPGRRRCSMHLCRPSLGDADARCIFVVRPWETQMLDVSLSSTLARLGRPMYFLHPHSGDRDSSNNYFISAPPLECSHGREASRSRKLPLE
jgi:hypothetical protein